MDGSSWLDGILEFDPLTGQWKEVAKMMKKRGGHALSTIKVESGLCDFQTTTDPSNFGSFLSGSVLVFLPGLMAKWFI